MKNLLFKQLFTIALSILFVNLYAQQSEIEYNSDSDINANGPHLLLKETGDIGNGSLGGGTSDDGWARLWFVNDSSPTDRWSFLARPHAGATDNEGVLTQPLVMAHNAVQKFGFGEDGTLRINKKYTLPNDKGLGRQVLTDDGNGDASWSYVDYTEKAGTISDPNFQFHEDSNGAASISFSNNQFANNRFYILADPSNTSGVNARMRLAWANIGTSEIHNLMYLDASDYNVGINTEPDEDFVLYVKKDDTNTANQIAAHFGEFNAGTVGYVTINRPTSGSGATSILRLKDNDNTIAEFLDSEGDIRFEAPLEMRDKIEVFNADIELKGATPGKLVLGDVMNMDPKIVAPSTCVVGDVYLSNAGGVFKLRVCTATNTWNDL